MNNNIIRFFGIIAALLHLASCKFDVSDFSPPEWEADLIGPLAYSEMRLEDVQELNGLEFSKTLSAGDLGIPTVSGNIPAVNIPDQDPFEIHFFEDFYYVEADSINLTVIIANNLPIDIAGGGTIEFRNKSGGDIIHTIIITDAIPQNTSYPLNIIITDKLIEEYIEIALRNFSTLEEDDAEVTPDNSITVTLLLDFISIRRASVKANASISVSDTTDFNLKGEGLNVISIEGLFNVYIDNGFPFSGRAQAYFLSAGSVTLYDSLFQDSFIEMPELNSNGEVTASVESKLVVDMDTSRVRRILDSKKVYFNIRFTAPGYEPLIADNRFPVKAQLVGDLKVKVQN